MTPTQHRSNNDVLRPPPGATREECRPLAITRVIYEGMGPGVISYWKPSDAEIELLLKGAHVRLSAIGGTHPPVAIGVDGDGLI